MSVQSVKDSFYGVLRDRVAFGNPGRTVVLRGVLRAGVVVAENELPGVAVDGIALPEAFTLRWTGLRMDGGMQPMTVAATCEIRYASDGSTGSAGMDRGRGLSVMDAELTAAVQSSPMSADLVTFSESPGGGASTQAATGTKVWWGDVLFKPAVMRGERMERTAEIEVYGYV